MKFHLLELAIPNLDNVLISSGVLISSVFENDLFFFYLEETSENMEVYFAEIEFYIIKFCTK